MSAAEQIAEALLRLPIAPGRERMVGFYADSLDPTRAGGYDTARGTERLTDHELPSRRVTHGGAAEELGRVAGLADKLEAALYNLSVTACDNLNAATPARLEELRLLLLSVLPDLETGVEVSQRRAAAVGRVTKIPDEASLALARGVGFAFARLTKTRPSISTGPDNKASGPFLDLVTAVFRIGAIDASPEFYARQAAKLVKLELDRQGRDL